MVTPRTLSRSILFLTIGCLGNPLLSQEDEAGIRSAPPVEVIDGAANPELISDEALFMSLSRLLEAAGPGSCSSDERTRGLSTAVSCLLIEGVDMARAEQLAQEFTAYSSEISTTDRTEFCDQQQARGIPFLSPEELAAEIEELEQNSNTDKVGFFMDRGDALLGQEGMDSLLDWANENLKRDINERRIDYADLMRASDLSPEQFLRAFCSANR